MTATRKDIEEWFAEAKQRKSAYLVIGHDQFSHENYPVFCKDAVACRDAVKARMGGTNMQRIDEIYDMSLPKKAQFDERRAYHYPSEELE